MYTLEEVIQQAKDTRAKFGYSVEAAVCKTRYSANKYTIGFYFENGLHVGYKGQHPSGDEFEVLAIV